MVDASAPSVWTPSAEFLRTANFSWLMKRAGVDSWQALHAWSVEHRDAYWTAAIERLGIRFQKPFSHVLDLSQGVESPAWLVDAHMNIVESCFSAPPDSTAIIHQSENGELKRMTVVELETLTRRVAANLVRCGFKPGDALAVLMPMTAEAVAIYLGIIRAGCVVVSIADSFQPKEIATRLQISRAAALFTRDVTLRSGKELPLYTNAVEAGAPRAIVLPATGGMRLTLREGDLCWADFLADAVPVDVVPRRPSDPLNILFSSGTTGDPKAIPWTQTTPIKAAADAHFHQNIQPGDVVVWPSNLGWMMGPWLIFASLLNRAAMGLYDGAPNSRGFCEFVQRAGTTMLGLVPSLVKAWRETDCLKGLDWNGIEAFSSTGECSNPGDMQWLMAQAGGRPVIEYCGGTEIGGGYVTGTMARPCVPGTFNTPALGIDFVIHAEAAPSGGSGEVFLIPPSIGLSTELLNKNHHEVYFAETPEHPHHEVLRRHGDEMQSLPDNYWRALGRADDTMNLGGIKVSSAEIEKAVQCVPGIVETAAIAVSPGGGPCLLVIFAVCSTPDVDLAGRMQDAIKRELNPLFKIHEVIRIDALPRTASNKVMRRVLRDRYVPGV